MRFASAMNRGFSALVTATYVLAAAPSWAAGASSETEAAEEATWFHLSPSTRPAYVGIHGGTAPITLLRGPDGSVYALTGQTGNDFIVAIRNGNASKQNAPVDAPREDEPDQKHLSNDAVAVRQTPVENGFSLKILAGYEDDSIYNRWSDSIRWLTALSASTAAACQREKAEEDIIAPKPENYPDVVFTSGEAAGKLALSRVELSPFGLTVGDIPLSTNVETLPPEPQMALHAPLRLHDYRSVLGKKI